MKRKSLLFALLVALFMPWAANAQNRTLVTIGDGTSSQSFPLPGWYGYQYDVFIYTPSAAPELGVDSEISSLAFDVASNSALTGAEMYIWVKDVDANYALATATTFNEYITDATQVYANDEFTSTLGWNTFNFSSTFSHEGGKALLVAIRGVGCSTGGGCSRSCRYTSASNTCWNKHVDTNDPGQEVSGNLSSNRANIQLDLTYTGAVCFTPSGLTYTNVVENAATLSWTENGEGTAWVLEYSTASDYAGATTVNVSGTPTTSLSGLSALTTYYVRVKADCGSDWLTGSFTTTAHAEAVGDAWNDDFEGTSCGWELINGTLANAWAWGTATNNGGTHALYISNDGGTSNAYTNNSAAMVYATKLLSFAEDKYEFSYDWIANGEGNYDYLRVALVPASVTLTAGTSVPSGFSTTALPTGWIALDGGGKLNGVTAWQSKSVAIDVTAGNYYLVMAWRDDTSGGTNPPAAVDNVSITRVACPYVVEDLETLQIWTTSALLFWSRDGGEDWQVAYADNANFDNAIYKNFTSQTSYTIINLTPATTYYVKMRAHCGGEDFGSWSEVLQFNTKCEAMDLANENFSENFDGITLASTYTPSTQTLPICWSSINTSTYSGNAVYPTMYYYSYTDYSHSTPNSLRFYSSYSNYSSFDPQDEYAILPAMENLAGKQITLWIRGYNATTPFKVGMITDPTEARTFVEITNDANPSLSTSYQEFTYIIPADATANYVAIMMEAANSSNSTRGLYIDDIKIADAPTCAKPTELEATADALTATITWMSEVGEYEVAYSTDNTANPDENIAGTATEETYTMNDLALGDHYFWVRANCGSDGYSEWVGPVSVHIGYCVPTPSNVDGNGISNVTFGMGDNIVNNDTPKATYADYSSQIGAVQAGVESTIAITYATGYTYGTIIWVDLDNSLSFEDSEIVYRGTSGSDNPTTLNAAITIPAMVTPGDYMMRIGGADSGFDSYISDPSTTAPSACYTGNWACFQDYTLRVLEAPSCMMPTDLAVNYTGGTEATISWTSDAEAWNMRVNGVDVNGIITNPYTLTGLELATTYSVEVQANCGEDGTSEWSNAVSFSTDLCMPENQCEISYSFYDQYDDSWNGAYMNIVDATTEEVLYELTMPEVDSPYEGSFNVCDGRDIQFVWVSGNYPDECGYEFTHNGETILEKGTGETAPSAGVVLTYTVNCTAAQTLPKEITGYGEGDGNYYLIALPFDGGEEGVNPETIDGMLTDEYDLYYFDEEGDDEGNEWMNYKVAPFNLKSGKGYLYASKNPTTLTFTGNPIEGTEYTVTLKKTDGADWSGWNLVGNPFNVAAYIDRGFYTLDGDGKEVVISSSTSIEPMEGIFVEANSNGEQMTFTTNEPLQGKKQIVLNLTQGRGNTIDRAIVRFGQSQMMPKFMLNENHTKMYIPKDNKDFAMVSGSNNGRIPVNFEPAEDGTYFINVDIENVRVKYLHLIDRETGMDVDLLLNPTYKFEAKKAEKPNRFELVFKTGSSQFKEVFSSFSGDNFSFCNNGNWIINNDGDAILQVIDINGQILSSERISGSVSKHIDATPGVYMLRLVNGENVKVQKIVVE